jgi:sigma-E factor negative regulatory protein RseC
MRQTVTVISRQGDRATVAYDRPTACHGDCQKCQGGCGSTAARERVTVVAQNPIGAAPGDRVVIEAQGAKVAWAIALVYVLPLVLFFLGYALGSIWHYPTALSLLGFLLGLLGAIAVSQHQTRTRTQIAFQIVAFARET